MTKFQFTVVQLWFFVAMSQAATGPWLSFFWLALALAQLVKLHFVKETHIGGGGA